MLTLVPTPIGNLGDMTIRGLEVLKAADLILCEDTRTSGQLLKHFEIHKPLQSYHLHNEHKITEQLIPQLRAQNVALITDAGTPGISDPGFYIVRACVQNDIEVICLPGATAFVPALVMSGLPCERFVFEGFLPPKKGRMTKLKELAEEEKTMILYESPYRLAKTLNELAQYFGQERQASVSREISKLFEETKRGNLTELAAYYNAKPPKGEIVIIVEGKR